MVKEVSELKVEKELILTDTLAILTSFTFSLDLSFPESALLFESANFWSVCISSG